MMGQEGSEAGRSRRVVVVANQLGLHARPAGVLAQEAQKYSCAISLVHEDQAVDAKSILDILTLALSPGSRVELAAEGEDAENALDRLEELFKSRFGEGK